MDHTVHTEHRVIIVISKHRLLSAIRSLANSELVHYSINLTNYIGLLDAFLETYTLSELGSLLSLKLNARNGSVV
jgi:hypothetical protein